jgi:integrase
MAATTGIRQRHGNGCKRPASGCKCPWEAAVYSKQDEKKLRQTFPTQAAAKLWRSDSSSAVRKKLLRAPKPTTIEQAGKAWLEGARKGLILTRSGDPYKPAAVRAYEAGLRLRVFPQLGSERLSDLTRVDLQVFVNGLLADGLNPSTIVVTLLPVRAIYKQAMEVGDIAVNPTTGLKMPAVRGGRDRIASPEECSRLLGAMKASDRPLWATAMYAGLRRGELTALRVEDVDLAAGLIHVRRGWDYVVGEIATKSGKDRRVPIAVALRDYLDEHLLRLDWRDRPDGLVFGSAPRVPFTGTPTTDRAKRAWKAAKLDAITLHECRHTFASLMIAAGVNAKALSTYMGHANIKITLDTYGHLMPGNEAEAAGLLDAYLLRADTSARLAQLAETGANTGASSEETA